MTENNDERIYGGLDHIPTQTIVMGGRKAIFGGNAKDGYRLKLINLKYKDNKMDAIGFNQSIRFGTNEYDDGTRSKIIQRTIPKIDKRISDRLAADTKRFISYMAKEYNIQDALDNALIELIKILVAKKNEPVSIDGSIGFLLDKIGEKYFRIVPSAEKVPRTLKYLATSLLDGEKMTVKEPELINPVYPSVPSDLKKTIDEWPQPSDESSAIKSLMDKEGMMIEYIDVLEQYYVDTAKDIMTIVRQLS
jgi:hypothetical protein